jgi:hypothetical protein
MLKYSIVVVGLLVACPAMAQHKSDPSLFMCADEKQVVYFTSTDAKQFEAAPAVPHQQAPKPVPVKPVDNPVQAPSVQPQLECHAPMVKYAPVSYEYRQAAPRRGVLRRGWFRGGGFGLFRGRFGGC